MSLTITKDNRLARARMRYSLELESLKVSLERYYATPGWAKQELHRINTEYATTVAHIKSGKERNGHLSIASRLKLVFCSF